MPRRDCGPRCAEWHAKSCFCPTTRQTCVILNGVMLSSRSKNPGGPVRDPHPPKRPADSLKMTYASHPESSSTPSSSNILSRLAEARVLPYALPELGRLVSSRTLLSLAAQRESSYDDSQALDSLNYADHPNSR
ncbi:hypothetical protein TNCT_549261 [Trichonephila clavata]|uniref:Uncharacterized protein n=1 Tax=Trichonephila clavata TaxID=2740835 RepID=A0A8X6KEL3_TRICU|nr:hypothetical protein TNCT_549261 [Trichonephila clavata]